MQPAQAFAVALDEADRRPAGAFDAPDADAPLASAGGAGVAAPVRDWPSSSSSSREDCSSSTARMGQCARRRRRSRARADRGESRRTRGAGFRCACRDERRRRARTGRPHPGGSASSRAKTPTSARRSCSEPTNCSSRQAAACSSRSARSSSRARARRRAITRARWRPTRDRVEEEAVAGQALVEPLRALLERGEGHRARREADARADRRDVVEVVVETLELEQQRAGAAQARGRARVRARPRTPARRRPCW